MQILRYQHRVQIASLVSTLFLAFANAQGQQAPVQVEIANSKEMLAYFEKLGYTPKAWQAGIREVPRLYVADIPSRWREKGSKELPIIDKKRIFFRALAPIVLGVNELIADERARAEPIARALSSKQAVQSEDLAWFRSLATRYGVLDSADEPLDASRIQEVMRRVDIVPPSLALAQAASESGWGTSRFADEGNSLFGQWSWSGGIKPEEQRADSHGDHRIAAFDSTSASVQAYVRNLNTHRAYQDFRSKREELRERNAKLHGADLVGTLISYSERGQVYVDELTTLMRQNQLAATDDAYLKTMQTILLVPKISEKH